LNGVIRAGKDPLNISFLRDIRDKISQTIRL
jgi:hypothetical protein